MSNLHADASSHTNSQASDDLLLAKGAKAEPGKRAHGIGQSVKGGVQIKLVDPRRFGNLGSEGTYALNPTVSATLGANAREIGDPTVALGDNLLGSHVQMKVENAQTKREAADGGHQQLRFNARYTVKNADKWQTPKMSLNMKVANTAELKGSVDAKAPLKIAGVGVEGGANIAGGATTAGEVSAAISEFQAGGTDSYFAHSYDVEIVISSSGYAVAGITQSFGQGSKQGIHAEQRTITESVDAAGQKKYQSSPVHNQPMPLLR